jgi:hypothetical protein
VPSGFAIFIENGAVVSVTTAASLFSSIDGGIAAGPGAEDAAAGTGERTSPFEQAVRRARKGKHRARIARE